MGVECVGKHLAQRLEQTNGAFREATHSLTRSSTKKANDTAGWLYYGCLIRFAS